MAAVTSRENTLYEVFASPTYLPKEVTDNAFYLRALYTYKKFKQTTGTMIPPVYVGSIVI